MFDGLQYVVTSFDIDYSDSERKPQTLVSKSMSLTKKMQEQLRRAQKNSPIIIKNIKAKIRGSKNPPTSVEQISVTLK